ncbi:unnamed protein product [Citrullus colocynthis]|uniref:Bulb-type lectin domain-containing protein n=1 Tax=Citrullus colocynthis TaxID=252529 RepID=A0ABP0YDS5_9ROSI
MFNKSVQSAMDGSTRVFDKIPERTLVWSANRDDPAQAGSNIVLRVTGEIVLIHGNGKQVSIYHGKDTSYASMSDDGNFVLFSSSSSIPIWQSFDSPTDTLLPGQNYFGDLCWPTPPPPPVAASGQFRPPLRRQPPANSGTREFHIKLEHNWPVCAFVPGWQHSNNYIHTNAYIFWPNARRRQLRVEDSNSAPIEQSFDSPTDTLLPGQEEFRSPGDRDVIIDFPPGPGQFSELASTEGIDVERCKEANTRRWLRHGCNFERRCVRKRTPLMNARNTSNNTKGLKILIKVPLPSANTGFLPNKTKDKSKYRKFLEIGNIIAGILAICFGAVALFSHPMTGRLMRRKSFWSVDVEIAVKRLDKMTEIAEKEFLTEATIIGRTYHKNLVRLLGYCVENEKNRRLLLVCELMPNGAVSKFLFGSGETPNWTQRVEIAIGIARGLALKCTARCKLHGKNNTFWDIESVEEGSNEKEDGGERDIRVHGAGVAEGSSGDGEG